MRPAPLSNCGAEQRFLGIGRRMLVHILAVVPVSLWPALQARSRMCRNAFMSDEMADSFRIWRTGLCRTGLSPGCWFLHWISHSPGRSKDILPPTWSWIGAMSAMTFTAHGIRVAANSSNCQTVSTADILTFCQGCNHIGHWIARKVILHIRELNCPACWPRLACHIRTCLALCAV